MNFKLNLKKYTRDKNLLRFLILQGLNIIFTVALGKYIAVKYVPSEFGEYSLVTAAMSLISLMVITPAIQSFRQIYFTDSKKDYFVSFYATFFLIFTILIFTVAIISSFFIENKFIIILCAIILCLQAFYALFNGQINLEKRNVTYSFIQIVIPISTILTLLILNIFSIGSALFQLLFAMMTAQLIVMLLSNQASTIKVRLLTLRKFIKADELNQLYKYIRPVLFLPLFSWILNAGDKFLIKYFIDDNAVGLYSASYSIGSKIFLSIISVLILWLNSTIFKEVSTRVNFKKTIKKTKKRIFTYFSFGIILVIIIYIFSDQIGYILLSKEYQEGFYLIGLLALAQLGLTGLQFWEQIIYASGLTKYILYHYIIGATINMILNISLIPVLGILGAAISMIIATFCQYIYLHNKATRLRL